MASMETATPYNAPGYIGLNDQPPLVPATAQFNTSNHVTNELAIRSAHLMTNEDIATNVAKRQRKDDNISKTTEMCFDEDLPDAKRFVTVGYKKQQRLGITVVFFSQPEMSFWRVNPNALATEVPAMRKEKLLDVHITRDGSILTVAACLEAANTLQVMTILVGISKEPKFPAPTQEMLVASRTSLWNSVTWSSWNT